MAEVPQVIRMTTNVVIDLMKQDLYVPVDEAGADGATKA